MSFFEKLKTGVKKDIPISKKVVDKEKSKKEWFEPEGKLAVDVYKTDNEIVIESPVAGIKPEDIRITIKGEVLTVRGVRERIFEVETKDYFTQECYWGKFSREVILPEETDPSRAEALLKNGILVIKIPKIHREKERVVEIKEE